MAEVTVKQLAETVGIPVDRLLSQLSAAGMSVEGEDQVVSESVERVAVELAAMSEAEEAEGGIPSEAEVQSQGLLQMEIQRLQEALNEAQGGVLRAQADVQNARRRAEKDVENAHKFALERFVKELLPVMDSLERAVNELKGTDAADNPDNASEGVSLTLQMFEDVLGKFNVEVVNPEGDTFDPQVHEAMCMQPTADLEPNRVVSVMQRGYLLNGRLVRPARVIVSQALPQ